LETVEDSPNQAAWYGSLGQSLAELGQYDEAIAVYRTAFAVAQDMGNLNAQAICRGSEGNALFDLGKAEEAVACYEEAIALSHEAGDLPKEGIWYGNLGNAYRKQGDLMKAVEYCQKALKLAQSIEDHHSEAAHLDSIGDCLLHQDDMEAALDKYSEALRISRSIRDRQGERIYLSNKGRAHQRMGQMEPAFESLRNAIDLFDEQRSAIRSDDLKTSFASKGQDLYRDMIEVCLAMGRRVEAIEYVGRAKSRAILDLLSNSPIDISDLSETDDRALKKLVEKESLLRNQIGQLERLFWQGPSLGDTGHRGGVMAPEDSHKIYVEWRNVINQLRRRHPNYANLIAVETLNFDEIKSLWKAGTEGGGKASKKAKPALDDKVAIIEYFWTDQYFLGASMWSGCAEPNLQFTNDSATLAGLTQDLEEFLEMSATEGWEVPVSLCRRLFDNLMRPLLQGMPASVERLILVPHGSLYRLPFAALHDGKQYVIERYSLSYLPTTSLVPILAGSRKPNSKLKNQRYLVSAISDYSATRTEGIVFSSRLRSAAGLDDLSYTMEEGKVIFELGSQHSDDAKLLTNQEVKDSLPQLFSEYPIVHFAGHAVFNPEEPLASGLVLSDGSILTAAAILQGNVLRTHCGKLLVLSACQTGVNMVTAGGEILGLARALMYAGMPNLILSLWEVADRSTANLMQDFHNTWRAGKLTIAGALQEAQRRAIAEKQPIHAWAPFVHVGIE
jgi:tetratricopeptide (TPR) repeat protein